MKTVKKLTAIILSIIIAFSLPVCANAAEGKFVSVSFETMNSDGKKEKTDEVLYTDGTYLYANPELFAEYTAYDYDEDNNAFVRAGQDFKLSLSSTAIDYKNKKATVKMMNSKQTFDLHNVFKFGNDYYLPLDQIAAYLKAEIKVDGTTVTVANSGYSVADAAYDFYESEYVLNYKNIVDEIFGGSETAYEYYTVLYYFSSTIFGLKVSNLIGVVGDIKNYKAALQKIVTDNTDYIKTQADPESFTKRLNDVSTFIKNGKEINDKLKDATTVFKAAYEIYSEQKGDVDNSFIEDLNADIKNYDNAFGKLKKVYSYTDYAVKYISMTEDNKNMLIDAYGDEDNLSTYKLALGDTTLKFGDDAATSLCSKALDILVEDVPKTTVKTFAPKALPALAVIKGTAALFKLLGFDMTDNSSYSIMLDSNIAHNLTERYSTLAETAGKTKDDTEAFRRAGIFATLAMKNAYNSGNKLNKKVNGQSKYYNKKIEEVALRAQLFYRAAESKGYDDLSSISSLATQNQKTIADSKITSKAKETDLEESTNNWRQAYMTFLREYMNEAETPENCGFSLVFIDNDNIPELVIRDGIAHYSGASVYTCVNSKVVKLIDDLSGTYGIIQYAERKGLVYSEVCYQGHDGTTIYKIKKGACTKLISLYSNEGAVSDEEELEYKINDKEVSETKYNTAWKKYENNKLLSSSDNDTELTSDSIEAIADYKI
ncbi:MAG: hypothetical protein Q4C99_08200 [Clostridia bacterium]|nr:hypothetical protein [Clostridia bacterium]